MRWKIGNFEFDTSTRRLSPSGERPLVGNDARVLEFLIKKFGQRYTNKQIIRESWEEEVAIDSLYKSIENLRRAFGGKRDSYIGSRPYQLVVTPELIADGEIATDKGLAFNIPVASDAGQRRELSLGPKGDFTSVDGMASQARLLDVVSEEHIRAHAGSDFLATISNCEDKIRMGGHDARTYLRLARAYFNAGHDGFCTVRWVEAVAEARQAIASALRCDERMSSAYALRGMLAFSFDYNSKEADKDFLKALALDSRDPSTQALYARYLAFHQNFDKALYHVGVAIGLVPDDRMIASTEPWMYLLAGRYDEAIAKGKKVRSLFPFFPPVRVILGWAYQASGDIEKAIEEYQRALDRELNPGALASLGNAYAQLGNEKAANETLKRFDVAKAEGKIAYVSQYCRALVLAGFGKRKKGRCLDVLEQAYEQKSCWLTHLAVEPRWKPMRGEKRFEALLDKIGLRGETS
jgi:tetratricopeptide (TPR) repeat protein